MAIKQTRSSFPVIVCGLLLFALLGVVPGTALAQNATRPTGNIEGENDNAYLTKVLSLKEGVEVKSDDAADTYEFTFVGSGTVGENLVSGGVKQTPPLQQGDVVPVLGNSGVVTLSAASVDTRNAASHKLGEDNNSYVYVIRKSLKDVVKDQGVTFSKPGIYTYRVRETGINKIVTDNTIGVTQSQASYLMKVSVIYDEATQTNVPINIDVVKEADDAGETDGDTVYPQNKNKVDPSYPRVSDSDATLIDTTTSPENISETDLAPDNRGRNVYGFTFANEYVIGMAFNVKKEITGDFGDRAKTFQISVTLSDESAPDNCRYVYQVFSKSRNGNEDVWTQGQRKAAYFQNKSATITEELKDGDYISIVGLQGFYESEPSKTDDISEDDLQSTYTGRAWFGDGVIPNTPYTVEEGAYENYKAAVYTFDDGDAKTITHTTTGHNSHLFKSAAVNTKITASNLKTDSADKTVIVLNTFDDSSTSFTGIVINNMPYILIVGVALALLGVKLVSRVRAND